MLQANYKTWNICDYTRQCLHDDLVDLRNMGLESNILGSNKCGFSTMPLWIQYHAIVGSIPCHCGFNNMPLRVLLEHFTTNLTCGSLCQS